MKRKYKGAQRIALIRQEIDEAIQEIINLTDEVYISDWMLDIYYKACESKAFALADNLKQTMNKKFGKSTVEEWFKTRAWNYSASDNTWFERWRNKR